MAQTGNCRKHVLDISMAPVPAFDLGNGCNIAGTEGIGFAWQKHQERYSHKQQVLCL